MAITIKEIGEGKPYHITFKKTQVYQREFGDEEELIDEYFYEDDDEDYSEIIWRVPIGRGFVTWFNFNKVERLEELGVIDYHKNLFLTPYKYVKQNEIEYVLSEAAQGQFKLLIQKNRYGFSADIMILHSDWYYRIHLSDPSTDSFTK